ncbi:ATP-binding cassette domain-containing protein [Paenibacillus marinisediminis]
MLSVHTLSKQYGNHIILKQISFSIEPGQVMALIGRNGCGKSTLLRILTGLTSPTQGKIEWQGSFQNRRIGYVPDRFPKQRLTAAEYLTSMGSIQGISQPALEQRIDELLSYFHMMNAKHQRMGHYSKGMLQKINVIQALLSTPDLLLLDEPLSGLDLLSQQDMIMHLQGLKERGVTMVIASHEPEIISGIADRIIRIQDGEGVEEAVHIYEDTSAMYHISFIPKNPNWNENLQGYELMYESSEKINIQVKQQHSNLILRQLIDRDCQIIEVWKESD